MTYFAKLMIALGLATASLGALTPAPAEACGGSTMSPEDEVLGLAWAAVADEPGARIVAVRRLGDDTMEVEVRWATYRPGAETAQYLYFAIDERGQWAGNSHSYEFTVWRDLGADARKPTPRTVTEPRTPLVAKR